MQQGIIKWYSEISKVGFISRHQGYGDDLFFRAKSIVQDDVAIATGLIVEYKEIAGKRGPHATEIRLLEPSHRS